MTDKSALHTLVDAMLDRAEMDAPGVEYGITVDAAVSLLLRRDSEQLYRPDDAGRLGYYSGHVYSDRLVDGFDLIDPNMVFISPVVDRRVPASLSAPAYEGDLATGIFEARHITGN